MLKQVAASSVLGLCMIVENRVYILRCEGSNVSKAIQEMVKRELCKLMPLRPMKYTWPADEVNEMLGCMYLCWDLYNEFDYKMGSMNEKSECG